MIDIATIPWLYSKAKKEAAKDRLRTADVIGDGIAIVAVVILIIYFVNSQASNSGFFTDGFGSLEAFFFYGVAIVGLFPPALRLILRRRNAVRPVEIVNSIFIIVAIIYLLNVFPFDFAHLASPLPSFIQTAVSWLTNDLVRLLMILGVVLTVFITTWTLLIYLAVRNVLGEQAGASPIEKRE